MQFFLKAPAKINWFLSVVGKRPDGYHDLVSLMQCVDLFDGLQFSGSDQIEVISEIEVPVKDNLVYKAAMLLREKTSYRGGASIRLRKEIPMAAGLGGGSSDAAFTLLGLNRLWGLGLGREQLMGLAADIGSDVPFFIAGSTAMVEGRGERVMPLAAALEATLLLVNPGIAVSAGWAYGRCNPGLTKIPFDIKLFCQAFAGKDRAALSDMIFNDLEAAVAAEYPVIAEIKERLIAEGAVAACMSGSGSTVFGVFGSEEEALRAANGMSPYWRRVVKTLSENYDV